MKSESLRLRSSDGVDLEAVLDTPEERVRAGLVLCHPHPNFGGTMNAPLLNALRDELVGRKWAVLRFNFRGVGSSTGRPSLGEAEVADAVAGISFLQERLEVPLALAGWSFGGGVAIRAAAKARSIIRACAAVAPSVERKEGITVGLPPPSELGPLPPLLFILASNDELVSGEAATAWAEGVDGAHIVTIAGANHFFWARYDELAATVCDWLDEVV